MFSSLAKPNSLASIVSRTAPFLLGCTALSLSLLSPSAIAQGGGRGAAAATPAAPAAVGGAAGGAGGGGGAAAAGGGAAAAGGGGQDVLLKRLDDLLWYQKMGDIADIDKDEYTGDPVTRLRNRKTPGAQNPILLHLYTFIPKKLDKTKKQPLIVFVHQGVHASLDTTIDAHLVRELVQQGYTVVASDYRGSTGYGQGLYQEMDYGGLEVDDVYKGMQFMLQRYSWLDPKRVGIVGWSHGGLITLMNIFAHPHNFAVA